MLDGECGLLSSAHAAHWRITDHLGLAAQLRSCIQPRNHRQQNWQLLSKFCRDRHQSASIRKATAATVDSALIFALVAGRSCRTAQPFSAPAAMLAMKCRDPMMKTPINGTTLINAPAITMP